MRCFTGLRVDVIVKYLLDTHIYLWWLNNDRKLSGSFRKVIENTENEVFVSVVSFWEISVKIQSKKLPLRTSFFSLIENLQFRQLFLTFEHTKIFHKIPLIHKDPFDRMLIAQALAEKLTIITGDSKFARFDVPQLGSRS